MPTFKGLFLYVFICISSLFPYACTNTPAPQFDADDESDEEKALPYESRPWENPMKSTPRDGVDYKSGVENSKKRRRTKSRSSSNFGTADSAASDWDYYLPSNAADENSYANPQIPDFSTPDSSQSGSSNTGSSNTRTSGTTSIDKLLSRDIRSQGPWTWIWQYQGSPQTRKADFHVLDGFDHSAQQYASVISKGSFPIAYFSCSFEPWRPDANSWTAGDKGPQMDGWDELWPNGNAIKNHSSNIWSIYKKRLTYMANKLADASGGKFQAFSAGIEWDNVDLYSSINLGQSEGLRFLKHLKSITESAGFVFVLKNSVEMIPHLSGVQLYVNEEAQQWNELAPYGNLGKPVLNVEYKRPSAHSYNNIYTVYYSSTSNINGTGTPIPNR